NGTLHAVNLSTGTQTTTAVAPGVAFRGFVWEDFGDPTDLTAGQLYFVMADGTVRCRKGALGPSCSGVSPKPVATGTVSQLLLGLDSLWVGGSDGRLYQIGLTTGLVETAPFQVGDGTQSLGPVSTDEFGDALYVATSGGTVYKIALTGG